jgi:diketogulonate reductase-like aldo/keto reductase
MPMPVHISDAATLSNGVKMPWLGLGVWRVEDGDEVKRSVRTALELGYRSIDTATLYQNENGVGEAIRESGLAREDIFVTTKVWNSDQGYESTLKAFEDSRKKLGLDVVDLYLVHWPVKGKYKETWEALEKLYHEGKVRAIGVSNFLVHHLEDLMKSSSVKPMVNQVEYHPLLIQPQLRQFCKEQGIQLEAWRPLMGGRLDLPVLDELAREYGKTPAQIVLRWDLQHGVVTIPKSIKPHRIEENAGIFDFELSAEDMKRIDSLDQNHRFGADPDNFDF